MRKMLFLALLTLCLLSITMNAYAIELTDEYIDTHGIASIDETGRETILIPLYTREVTQSSPEMHANSFAAPTDSTITPDHFVIGSFHNHHVYNVRTTAAYKSQPISRWADEGIIISWTEGWSLTFSLSLNLVTGISESEAEDQLGISIGGSYTATESNSYTAPAVPAGYEGRLALRIQYDHYTFDDRIEYYTEYNPSLKLEEILTGNSGDGQPYRETVYLELVPK